MYHTVNQPDEVRGEASLQLPARVRLTQKETGKLGSILAEPFGSSVPMEQDPEDWAHAVLGAAAYAVALNQLRASVLRRKCLWPRIGCEQMRIIPKCYAAGDGQRTGWWGLQGLCKLTGMHGTMSCRNTQAVLITSRGHHGYNAADWLARGWVRGRGPLVCALGVGATPVATTSRSRRVLLAWGLLRWQLLRGHAVCSWRGDYFGGDYFEVTLPWLLGLAAIRAASCLRLWTMKFTSVCCCICL